MFLRGINISAIEQILIRDGVIGDHTVNKFILAHHGVKPPERRVAWNMVA
jgi:hypothetical protein